MKPRFRSVAFIFWFCFLISSISWAEVLPSAKPEEVGLSSQRLERIGAVLRADIEKGRLPGAVVLIARKGKVAYFESFGMRDKDSGAPMQKDSIFRVYSMSKPIVSVAAMILHEEGKFFLSEPVSKYLPALGGLKVGVEGVNSLTGGPIFYTVPAQRDMTIQDLLRHTSGLTYGVFGKSAVKSMYLKADSISYNQTVAEMTEKLGKLPLAYQPGTRWEYSQSTDVLGHLIQVISGMDLDQFVEDRVLRPLKMDDSGFYVKPEKLKRVAEGAKEPQTGKAPSLIDVTKRPKFFSGGGGMVSTATDYARFCQFLLNGGQLNGTRLLSRKTVEYMTSDHLGSLVGNGLSDFPSPGYGFGLGFGVRLQNGISLWPGSKGEFFWGGMAGTYFWVDPREEMFVVYMMQSITERNHYRFLMRNLVYQSIVD